MKAREADSLRTELSKLTAGMGKLRRRMEQLAALRDDATADAAQIARLERELEFDRVVRHVRSAMARAVLDADPVPHLLVSALLPPGVYEAVIQAIPPPAFFDGRLEQGQELRVPPRLAPMPSIVTWMFVDEVGRMVSELLVARLAEPLEAYTRAQFPSLPPFRDWNVEITLTEARLVRRTPGYAGRAAAERSWELVTGVIDLARQQDSHEYGSRLRGRAIPFRANTALVRIGGPDAHAYCPIPLDVSKQTERYTYEFGIGPSKAARRRLAALMTGAA